MRAAVYWDASAVLSAVTSDVHSDSALAWYRRDCVHLISTLAYAETCSVLSRLHRENTITGDELAAALDSIASDPWRRLHASPGWDEISAAAGKWNLRGADLWHLVTVLTLREHRLPGLLLLTYDAGLASAVKDECLAVSAMG